MQTFGQRLREKREAAGLTQAQVAKELGMSREAYAMIETGVNGRTLARVPSLAKALGCSTDSLFPEMDPQMEPKEPEQPEVADDEFRSEGEGSTSRKALDGEPMAAREAISAIWARASVIRVLCDDQRLCEFSSEIIRYADALMNELFPEDWDRAGSGRAGKGGKTGWRR